MSNHYWTVLLEEITSMSLCRECKNWTQRLYLIRADYNYTSYEYKDAYSDCWNWMCNICIKKRNAYIDDSFVANYSFSGIKAYIYGEANIINHILEEDEFVVSHPYAWTPLDVLCRQLQNRKL